MLSAGLLQTDGAIHPIPICKAQRLVSELGSPDGQLFRRGGAAEEGEVGVSSEGGEH